MPVPNYADDPAIKEALDAGYSLEQIADPRTQQTFREAIYVAGEKYGPRSDEVNAAIDAANAASVMLTSARAAYNRLTPDDG